MDKQGKGQMVLLIIVGIAAYLLIFGVPKFGDDETPTTPSGTTGGSVGGCNVEQIGFTPKMFQEGKAGTVVTTDNFYILTNHMGGYAAGTSPNVPTNKDLEVMYGENSTTYYTVVKKFNTGCINPYVADVGLPKVDTAGRITAENEDGSVNTVSNAQPLAGDESVVFEVCYKTASDTYFGNPTTTVANNIGVVEYDLTFIKQAKSSLGQAASLPSFFAATNASNDGRDAVNVPKVAPGEKKCFTLTMDSTSANIASSDAQPILHLYDVDIDKNEDTLALIEGVIDEDNNMVSLGAQTKTLYLS